MRKQFHRDYDRIIFSDAFRRLGSKTQVHPLPENDQVRTRLSHSLEVSCVGRTFGMVAGEWLAQQGELPSGLHPDDLGTVVQAAALAHDIGNPPFGHAGEDAIRAFFTPELLAFFEQEDAYHLECDGHELVVFKTFMRRATSLEVEAMLEFSERLAASLASRGGATRSSA
ncbi:MAG: HD domain-containing protein [Litorivicinus sp.]